MLWDNVFEIPLPPKLKIFQNSTLEAFLNISKAIRHSGKVVTFLIGQNFSSRVFQPFVIGDVVR